MKLYAFQSTAIGTATGSLLITPIQHLHSTYPCSHLLEPEPPLRHIRRHLFNFNDEIQGTISRQLLDRSLYRQANNGIHRENLTAFLNSRTPNAVIGVQPPSIADDELQLPLKTCVTLVQLWSGYCNILNSYLTLIDPDILNICAACEGIPHYTNHLFTCSLKATHLTLLSIWTQPLETACLLGLPLDEPKTCGDLHYTGRTQFATPTTATTKG